MIHKAWCSIEEVPYYFSRSYIKFQGHTDWKIDELDQIWARLLGRSQLSNPSDLPCCLSNFSSFPKETAQVSSECCQPRCWGQYFYAYPAIAGLLVDIAEFQPIICRGQNTLESFFRRGMIFIIGHSWPYFVPLNYPWRQMSAMALAEQKCIGVNTFHALLSLVTHSNAISRTPNALPPP